MGLTLREVLKAAGEVTLTLRSGAVFRGQLGNSGDDLIELLGEQGERHFLLASEIAAVTVYRTAVPQESNVAATRLRADVDYVWQGDDASVASQIAAQKMLHAISEALRALGPGVESEIRTIRLFSGQSGRFRVTGGVLEAGFIEDEDPPPVRELQSLLAAIL